MFCYLPCNLGHQEGINKHCLTHWLTDIHLSANISRELELL